MIHQAIVITFTKVFHLNSVVFSYSGFQLIVGLEAVLQGNIATILKVHWMVFSLAILLHKYLYYIK